MDCMDGHMVVVLQTMIQMGQQSSAITRIHQISQSLTLVRQLPGEKIYVNRNTDEEYLLITRLAQGSDDFESVLARRKELRCCYVPELVDYGKQVQGYCSDIAVLNMLFRHPAKSLAEEQMHRTSVGQCFEEGELLMISYCTLIALQEYSKMGDNYELSINEQTLLIEMDGKIVLTDTARFKEQASRRQSLRRICSEQGKIMSRIAIMQLGVVLFRMVQDDAKPPYSESLRHYVDLLKTGQFISYNQALIYLEQIKRSDRSASTKLPRSHQSLDSTPNPSNDTPIVELMHLIETRQPLRQLFDANQQVQGIKSFCYDATKKKQNKYQIYKSKFQARKTEAFAEQCINLATIQQQSASIRLDEMSSIQQRQTYPQTEQDEHQPIDNNNILPDGLASYQSQQQPPVARIELFSSNRPQRLKQLVLNQKGIIFEESADQISSLASQRTHRMRNFSNHHD